MVVSHWAWGVCKYLFYFFSFLAKMCSLFCLRLEALLRLSSSTLLVLLFCGYYAFRNTQHLIGKPYSRFG